MGDVVDVVTTAGCAASGASGHVIHCSRECSARTVAGRVEDRGTNVFWRCGSNIAGGIEGICQTTTSSFEIEVFWVSGEQKLLLGWVDGRLC